MPTNPSVPRVILALLVATALLLALPGSTVMAGTVSTQGTVTSGSSDYKIFSTQRIATQAVAIHQTDVDPEGVMRYKLYSCASSTAITGYHQIQDGQTRTFSHSSGCFRIGSRRDQPKDTNGIGFGSGNTTFYIQVTF